MIFVILQQKGFEMKLLFFAVLAILGLNSLYAQTDYSIDEQVEQTVLNNYEQVAIYFQEAHDLYPDVPLGFVEAVAYVNTRFWHVPVNADSSCTGMPRYYGIMGLIANGKNYFRETASIVSALSGMPRELILTDARFQIIAYTAAFDSLSKLYNAIPGQVESYIPVWIALSEIPYDEYATANEFAMSSHLYSIFEFLSNPVNGARFGFKPYAFDKKAIFGDANLQILESSNVFVFTDSVEDASGRRFQKWINRSTLSPDYGPAIWDPTTCNYSSRSGTAISAVTIHTVQGSYAGCISWFKNCDADASTHYVLKSSNGQITQMVYEADKAWHVTIHNPYTVGYEHEGYVDNPAWYTSAVYQSSANLTRDVCNAYGINTLRTFYRDSLDDGTSLDDGLHTLAGTGYCIQVAGHQHFSSQTHTDPGKYWCWDYYFKLINNNPSTTTLTSASGTFYDSGSSSANYGNDEHKVWVIQPTNASSVTLTFSSFALEANYDFIYIYDGNSIFAPRIGRYNTVSPGTVTSSGGALTIEFRADCGTTAAGWVASWTSNTVDAIAPSSNIATVANWKTDDFSASFTDEDNLGGSGIQKGYYQVLENQGSEWRANAERGFFADNFDSAIHADWTQSTGSWSINTQSLFQGDSTLNNTNIYASINQNLSNRYLYHFTAMVPGLSKVNKRFGFHYFSDDASLTNRGNGYFIFFRLETSKLEFYKVVNDVFTQMLVVNNVVTDLNTWYDIKVIYDRISGKTWVYRNDVLIGDWTDPTPFSSGGQYISFRSGNSQLKINDLKVYRSRSNIVSVPVGLAATDDIRFQNPSPSIFGAKIKSICQDSADNISAIYYHDLNVDFTPPSDISVLNDGVSTDEDIAFSTSNLNANWSSSSDLNSDIASYEYSIGTAAGLQDIRSWTNVGLSTYAAATGLVLIPGSTYYFNVRAINGAGLFSNEISSDGIMVATSTLAGFSASTLIVCAGDTVFFNNSSSGAIDYEWIFSGGNPSTSTDINPFVVYNAPGSYDVTLTVNGFADTVSITNQAYIVVMPVPQASFVVNDTLFYIPDAMVFFTNTSTSSDHYSWDFGDGTSSTDMNPWHLYSDTGYFSVSLKSISDICGSDSIMEIDLMHVVFPSSIEEHIISYQLYPNPANDWISIVFATITKGEILIELYTESGASIFGKEVICGRGSQCIEINLAPYNLRQGNYFLVLKSQDEAPVSLPLIIW